MTKLRSLFISFFNKIIYFFSKDKKASKENEPLSKPLSNSIKTSTLPISLNSKDTIINNKNKPINRIPKYKTPQIPKIISTSLISINNIDSSNSLLKIAIFLNCHIDMTADDDFMLLINNTILKDVNATIISNLFYKGIIQLTTIIPNTINSSNIFILIGSTDKLTLSTTSVTNHRLSPLFPFLKCNIINPLSFKWILNKHIFIRDNIEYYSNIFIYKLPLPLCIYNFGRAFTLYPGYEHIELDTIHITNIHCTNISSLQIKIINNYLFDPSKDLGSIYILFYITNKDFDFNRIFNKNNKILISLQNNNCEIHFNINLPVDFINNMSLIQSYYLPSEYLLTSYENTIFVNSSYKSIATKFESFLEK